MRVIFLFLLSLFILGCSEDVASITSSEQQVTKIQDSIRLSGRLDLSNAGGVNVNNINISVLGITTHPNTDGTYLLTGTLPKISGRVSENVDTVKVVIGNDTLVEIPVISWKDVLPTNYIVQRNVGCIIPKEFVGNTVQAVFWSNDSIAHVLDLGKTTSNVKYSGFIYTAYNDVQFGFKSTIYNLFARIKKNNNVVAYTEITNVTAEVGNLDYDSTQFQNVVNHIKYLYNTVPNDSSVKKYNDTLVKTLVIDTLWDIVVVDSSSAIQNISTKDTIHFETADSSYKKVFYKIQIVGDSIKQFRILFQRNMNKTNYETASFWYFGVDYAGAYYINGADGSKSFDVAYDSLVLVNSPAINYFDNVTFNYKANAKVSAHLIFAKIIKHYI